MDQVVHWWGAMWSYRAVILLVALLALFLLFLARSRRNRVSNNEAKRKALEILNERYARGEITTEQYEQMKKEILE